jgi:twitching motility protein PilT
VDVNDPLLSSIVRGALQMGASDIHLRPGQSPFLRVSGLMGVLEAPPLSSAQVRHCLDVCATGAGIQGQSHVGEFSVDLQGLARLRVSAFLSDGDWSLSLRLVPLAIPSFTELRLPPVMKSLATPRPGLMLVTGPTGAGKSTTSASLLQAMLQVHRLHLVTIEDPIEYRFVSPTSCITQRELGRDTSSPAEALRQAMRMDPDVIFVGEIRDDATFEMALHAAETGICVVATMHTQSAAHTISRISAMTRPDLQTALRERIAEALRAIVSQRLLPRRGTTKSRVVCTEVLVNNYSIKEAIRDPARHKAIPGLIERGQDQGMHTFDQALLALVGSGVVDVEVAAAFAVSPTNLRRSLQLGGAA